MSKILVFDIEASDLSADWGWTICFGYTWAGSGKVKILSITDTPGWRNNLPDDEALVRELHRVMSEADMYVTYFGKGFDLPFLQAKFMKYRLPVLANTAHVDLFFTVKSNMKLSRKSLDNVTRYLGLDEKKYLVTGEMWQRARVGNPDAIKEIIEHCKQDVVITEQLYNELRPYVRQHPRVGEVEECRHCGSTHLQRRGYAVTTLLGKRQRWQCMNCGGWDTRSLAHSEATEAIAN